jgi:uncharacterized protein
MSAPASTRSTLRQIPHRGSQEWSVISAILDTAFLAHVGFSHSGQPFVIPMLYGRCERKLYLHGSAVSRLICNLQEGLPACLSVTLIDGLVLARSAFHHSMNYRSVVAFGIARLIEKPQDKVSALRTISEHLLAGRWRDARGPNRSELAETAVLEFSVDDATAKIRQGPPVDDDSDLSWPAWAGVIPLSLTAGSPQPDDKLPAGTALPSYISKPTDRFR